MFFLNWVIFGFQPLIFQRVSFMVLIFGRCLGLAVSVLSSPSVDKMIPAPLEMHKDPLKN